MYFIHNTHIYYLHAIYLSVMYVATNNNESDSELEYFYTRCLVHYKNLCAGKTNRVNWSPCARLQSAVGAVSVTVLWWIISFWCLWWSIMQGPLLYFHTSLKIKGVHKILFICTHEPCMYSMSFFKIDYASMYKNVPMFYLFYLLVKLKHDKKRLLHEKVCRTVIKN